MGPRAGLDRCGKSLSPPGFDPRTVQPVASRYTDYATRPTYGCVVGLKGSHSFERLQFLRLHVHLFRRLSQSGEKGLLASSCQSDRPPNRVHQRDSNWTDLLKILDFYENLSRKSKFGLNQAKISATAHEDLSTYVLLLLLLLLMTT